ncbi:heterokaryon incompatibility, partial [Hyaloscypha bicolor E]
MYSALSYVWGDPTATEIVFVNCCPFPVTRNLYEALKAIRGETNTYTFWTDAICINQKDDDEKSHQISLMKKIYESATLIIAFLGESTKHTDDALEAIKRVHDFNPRSEFGDSALLGLKDICNRPYWTRVWIQQE